MTTTELPRHPRTGLRAIGRLSSGRPVWPQMGGDGTGDGGDGQGGQAGAGQQNGGQQQGAGGDGGNGQGTGQQGTGQGQQNNSGNQQGQQGGQESQQLGPDGQPLDPARLQRLVENLREENRQLKQRGNGQQNNAGQQGQGQAPGQQQNQQPQQQGQQQAGQAPAADDATAARLRDQAAQLAVFKHAGRHHGDPVMLTDSMSFMSKIRDLDPDAADYDTKVTDLLKKHLEKNPHHRTGQAPGTSPRGGSDGTGRPGAPNRPKGLGGALSAHYADK